MKLNHRKYSPLLMIVICALLFAVQPSPSPGQTKRSAGNKRTSSQARKPVQKPDETANWFTFTGVDEDFSVKTPVRFAPLTTRRNEVTTARQYGGDDDRVTLSIVLQEMGLAANNPYRDEFAPDFESVTAKLLREGGYEVISFRRLAPNTVDWEQVNPGEYHSLSRDIIKNARLYNLSCTASETEREVDRKLCRAFFNSFKFLD